MFKRIILYLMLGEVNIVPSDIIEISCLCGIIFVSCRSVALCKPIFHCQHVAMRLLCAKPSIVRHMYDVTYPTKSYVLYKL